VPSNKLFMRISKKNRYLLLMMLFCLSAGVFCEVWAKSKLSGIDSLAREYQSFREQHKKQKSGEFNKGLDAWDGRMHFVMEELGERLGTPGHTRSDIVRIMGKPDTVQGILSQEKKNPPIKETRLVYFWRGWHDYLFFVCQKDTIIKADWYFSGE
jgi:hypothetical protein